MTTYGGPPSECRFDLEGSVHLSNTITSCVLNTLYVRNTPPSQYHPSSFQRNRAALPASSPPKRQQLNVLNVVMLGVHLDCLSSCKTSGVGTGHVAKSGVHVFHQRW